MLSVYCVWPFAPAIGAHVKGGDDVTQRIHWMFVGIESVVGSNDATSVLPCSAVPEENVGAAAIAGAASTPATIAVDSVSTVADRERRPKTRQL